MPLVQFKDHTTYDGRRYRQNERLSCSEPRAARLVAMDAVELVHGEKVSVSFETMVTAIRQVRAKNRPPASPATREKAARLIDLLRRSTGHETASRF